MKEKTEEYIIIKKELDKIRQKEYYAENRVEIIKKITEKNKQKKPPPFQVIKGEVELIFN